MMRLLQIAVGLTVVSAACLHAQIVSPEVLIPSAPSVPQARQHAKAAADLEWLWAYTKPEPAGAKADLLADRRFSTLLQDDLRAPQAFWSAPGSPLADAARTFLAGEGTVGSKDNRHLTVTGCVVEHCAQRGLLWIDMGERDPLVVFAALRWIEQGHTTEEKSAAFTLWLFPNRALDPEHLSEALKTAIGKFTSADSCEGSRVGAAVLVDPNGIPHVMGGLQAGAAIMTCTNNSGTHL